MLMVISVDMILSFDYLLDENALMNWLVKMFRMLRLRGSISLAVNNALLAL